MMGFKQFAYLLFFFFFLYFLDLPAQTEDNIFDEAEKNFSSGDYGKAQELYAKLLDIKPQNLIYNAKYGVCLLNTDSNKAGCLKYLYFAATQPESSPLAIYYLAKAFQLNYKFDDAITYYQKFQVMVIEKEAEKYDIAREIDMCRNGKLFFNKPQDIDFVRRKSVNFEFFTSAYDLLLIEAKIYSVPRDFKSKVDIEQNFNTVMCLYNQENEAVYTSYGKTLRNGKDLCRKVRFGNEWSKSQDIKELNTNHNEEFPYIVADGKLLFFSSEGHNSMGGYDIFKSVWNQQEQCWSKPENLGYPINSPFDDLLFIPDKEHETAFFASNRNSPDGKIEIFKINYPKELGSLAIIKGKFQAGHSSGSYKAQITIIDVNADKLEGIFNTNEKNGNYFLALTPGRKYKFIIRTKGYAEHSFIMDVPVQDGKYELKQLIWADKDFQTESIISYNFFKPEEAEIISDKVMEALTSEQPTPEFTDILERHQNVAISEIVLKKNNTDNAIELVQLKHKKGGKKSKADEAFEEAAQSFEKKKQEEADNSFKLRDYAVAMKLYAELLANSPENTDNNYKFGICIFNSEKVRSKAVSYLKFAANSAKTSPDVFYYLAQINHLEKKYDEAIENYKKFSRLSSTADVKKFNVDRKIENCFNGKNLLGSLEAFEIINQKMVSSEGIFLSINAHEFSGRILMTPDDFQSDLDKKNNFKSTMFLTFDKNEIYYSSYGNDGKDGKDIYKRVKLASGEWSQPQYLAGINTPFDEDYPFIAPTGTIFFSSYGFNSMGGFDVFSSDWNTSLQTWSQPQNLGSPVNSPADDIYFVRCKDGESCFFSSDRSSLKGQTEIFYSRKVRH